jgi:hypothetical protein
MTAIVIILAVLLAISLTVHFMGGKDPHARPANTDNRPSEKREARLDENAGNRASKLEGDLDKKRKEIDELKSSMNDIKAELKDTKKKLYEAKEAGKGDLDLTKARADVERQASVQLDATRAELATALAEIQKLKTEGETKGRRAPKPVEEKKADEAPAVAAAKPAEPQPQVVVQKVVRELNEADKAKMNELEQKAAKARYHEIELERELKQAKGRAESQARQLRDSRKEATLAKDKFRAVEMRLNRTLLERDLTVKALRALEKQSGVTAERTELTAEEIAESDRKVKEQQAAQEKAENEAKVRLEAEQAAADAAAEAAASAAPVAAPAPSAPTTTPSA